MNCETARLLMETNDPALAEHLLSCPSCILRTHARYYEAPPNQLLAANVLAAHIRSLNGMHLLDVPSSDQHTVKPWFDGKLDFAPVVKEVEGFPLLGGRLEYFEGHSAAALVYGRRKHVINLFVWPSAAPAGEVTQARNGYHLHSWSSSGMAYWAVSDLNETELRQFVSFYQRD